MSRSNGFRIRLFTFPLAVFTAALPVLPDCLPVANLPIAVNGVVVRSSAISGAGCKGSAGWDGVPVATLVPVGGIADTHVTKLLATGHANGATLDHLYIGVHVENAEQFTSNDMLTLYFDADNSGSFDNQDFALHFEIGAALTPPTDENCNGTPHLVSLYTLNGGNWVPQNNAAGITAKTSWDYNASMVDPEYQIWELEIDINLATLGVSIPSQAAKVGIGGRLYVNTPAQGGTTIVFAYPSNLTTDNNPNDIDPNTGSVTADHLAKYDIAACGFDVVIDSISSTDTKGQTNYFTRFPNPITGTLSGNQTNTFTANVRFYDPAHPADTTVVGSPDAGNVNFSTFPYGNGVVVNPFSIGSQNTSFNQLGQTNVVTVQWPLTEADYSAHRNDFSTADHTCMKVALQGFPVNQNESADLAQQNLTFTPASTVKAKFHIKALREDPWAVKGYIEYLLRPRWQNVPADSLPKDPTKRPKGKWTFEFENARHLKMKYAGKGYWRLRLKPNEDVIVELELTGGKMPFQTQKVHVSPKAGGKLLAPSSGEDAMVVPVKEGMILGIAANGSASTGRSGGGDNYEHGPGGSINRRSVESHFLVSAKSSCVPWQNSGTLVASFDGFQTAFRIGGASTFVVPPGATQLSLAVNDVAGEYDDNAGPGFDVNIVFNPTPSLPTRLAGIPANPNNGQPAGLALGATMPLLNIDVDVLNPMLKALRPQGYVSWAVYESHQKK